MKHSLLLLVAVASFNVYSQCDLNVSASSQTITCGQSADLSAFGSSTGQVILNENFNSGGFGSGWGATPGATNFSNPCSPGGVDGTTHAWMDDNTSVPRTLTSAPYNLLAATAGVTICFDLLFAEQGDNAPCEGPDEPDEGVYLQYSINGGATWVDIYYFDPNGGNDPQLTNWNNWCFTIPAAAITSNTLFRWHQTADSGADYDHWGIDNVQIFQNDINAEVEWLHDGYSYGVGNPGGVNPNAVTPTSTTTYTAQITTGTGDVCTQSVTIVVVDPVYDVTVSANPTNICNGDCSTISGTGQIILDPGGVETFENNEFNLVASGNASINVNVQGINTSSIYNGLIQNVTINGFNFSGSSFCTSFGGCNCNGAMIGFGATCNLTSSSFTVTLTGPGGCTIILAPAGVASGNYINTVFVPIGGTAMGGTFPSSGGPWDPNQPFSTLNGCDPNGVWTLTFNAPGVGFGLGSLSGWSITFDNPPIYAPVDYSWSPTTGLSDPNDINTQACPSVSTDYVLTVSNGIAGCATYQDTVSIIVDCGCIPPQVAINPLSACGPSTFNLTTAIDPASDPATLSYYASQTDAQNALDPISTTVSSSGTYWVRIVDPSDPACFTTLPIPVTINSNPVPVINGNLTYCPGTNVTLDAGAGFADYDWSTGAVTQTIQSFAQTGITVTVTDANGCVGTSAPVNVTETPQIVNNSQIEVCAGDVALIHGVNQSIANTYSQTFTTASGCDSISNVQLIVNPLPVPIITGDLDYCTGSSANINAGAGYASYNWSTGGSTQVINVLEQNGITVTVTDLNGCEGTSAPVNVVEVSEIIIDSQVEICVGQSASIHGVNQSAAGVYSQTFVSVGGCDSTSNVELIINPLPNPVIAGQLWYCQGTPTILDAGPGYDQYVWSTGGNTQTIAATAGSGITVTVTDANGCIATSPAVTVVAPPTAVVNATPSVGNAPLDVILSNLSQNASNYYWNFGNGNDAIVNNQSSQNQTYPLEGQYTVMLVAEQNGCTDTAYVTIIVNGELDPMIISFPNVFTPNGDNVNEVFFANYVNVSSLEVLVLNRWGNVIFETDKVGFFWNGINTAGNPVEDGVYFYTYKATGFDGTIIEGHDFVTVER